MHKHTGYEDVTDSTATKLMDSINMRGTVRLEPVAHRERLEGNFQGGRLHMNMVCAMPRASSSVLCAFGLIECNSILKLA